MPRPKKPKVPKPPKPPPINKHKLIERLVEKPSQNVRFWLVKECSILKSLEKKFPLAFLNQLKYSKKWASLAVLFCDDLMKDLERRYRAYQYVPPIQEPILLGEKSGEDLKIEKKKSLREILA
jgi:hypothetical protein